ncbi:MAG: hypothetical protein L0H03_15310 [Rhodococcus sp. (in: high G+C Gram-positive bacteria)]|nr:hypothetical protein [Rhodococcus sp. (in: high G+C Gram-positive bacteria)]
MTQVERMLPLYQGMMTSIFDHRAADVVRSVTAVKRQNQPRYLSAEDHADTERMALPYYWVRAELIDGSVPGWHLAFNDVTSVTNERTLVAAALPRVGVNHKLPLVLPSTDGRLKACLLAMMNSFVVDYLARQKVGGNSMTYFYLRQFPVLSPGDLDRPVPWKSSMSVLDWVSSRSVYLSNTAVDMVSMAEDVGSPSAPIVWIEKERSSVRAELDAAMFLFYAVERNDVEYIMETFPIVKRKDITAHGEFRTKRLILETYDAMAEAIETGIPYESPFDDLLTDGE